MKEMSAKEKTATYYIEGPDWSQTVSVDADIFDDESSQIFEAATKAIEKEIKKSDTNFNIGPLLIVKKSKKAKKEKLVSAYICLNNAALYNVAEDLRKNFKAQTGQDIALDDAGIIEE